MQNIIEIPKTEADEFAKYIRSERASFIEPASAVVEALFGEDAKVQELLSQNGFSTTIQVMREQAYHHFLEQEAEFNRKVMSDLSRRFSTPKALIDQLISTDVLSKSGDELRHTIERISGAYAGSVTPYIYSLCLSNTQSRRSRAGRTFEQVIYRLYDACGFPFESQTKVGKAQFQGKGFGKMVDSLLPSIDAFDQRRDRVIIGTMKTTLRERWQEVVEEINRAGLPKIYLLTTDESISKPGADKMGQSNIVLVVLESVKNKPQFKGMHHIISFETYFSQEIPEVIDYWSRHV